MLIPNTVLSQLPVLDLQTGQQVAQLESPIIDPNRLKIVAFYCKGKFIGKGSVLHVEDIREYNSQGVIIDSQESILPFTADLVRLQEVAGLNFNLLDKQVIDDHRQKLGKVESYVVDAQDFNIVQFRVKQSMLKNLQESSLLINRHQIIELTDKFIVVKAPDVRSRNSNPIRSLLPQILTGTSQARSNSMNDK